MKKAWIIRTIGVLACALLAGWIIHHTAWVEIEASTPPTGAAAQPWYSLRRLAAAAGATVVDRTALEPMPPRGATLFLDSTSWDLFPERDAALRDWVLGGGRLVVLTRRTPTGTLRWVPPTFLYRPRSGTAAAASAGAAAPPNAAPEREVCETFFETPGSQPAFEPGRAYRRCLKPTQYQSCVDPRLAPSPRARPLWQLGNDDRTYAMRVQAGRGTVTAVAECLPVGNDTMLLGDHALIASAVLHLRPGAMLYIVDDEAGEPLGAWLWHHARVPLLLAITATVLALWRLMVRFGPREAPPSQARRSMGEQVRGTGAFMAATDPQALHAATRRAFDDAARARVEAGAERTDADRIAALAAALAPAVALDRAALLDALNPPPDSTTAQWLAAIEVVEQVRRTLLRAPTAPGVD